MAEGKTFDIPAAGYDWFKDQSKADDSLGWGLEANIDGEWEFLDQSEGGTNLTGSDN